MLTPLKIFKGLAEETLRLIDTEISDSVEMMVFFQVVDSSIDRFSPISELLFRQIWGPVVRPLRLKLKIKALEEQLSAYHPKTT